MDIVNGVAGPQHIGKAEPIDLQFGHFRISACLSDTGGGTSHASSFDESRGELTDNGSRYFSSCCTSPKFSDGHAKDLKEEQSVMGGDDAEVYEPPEIESDDDSRHVDWELEGSVDENYTQSMMILLRLIFKKMVIWVMILTKTQQIRCG
ncbi:hypothetical protein HAX54_002808 [Datura stramonium]|uniref:Uncharacterized protein n=1 Tax=Datura stramonium TaxID=4076 RepID=A0ABS8T5G7_DATST|nr:hypothetical protein [Datura stramonium]